MTVSFSRILSVRIKIYQTWPHENRSLNIVCEGKEWNAYTMTTHLKTIKNVSFLIKWFIYQSMDIIPAAASDTAWAGNTAAWTPASLLQLVHISLQLISVTSS